MEPPGRLVETLFEFNTIPSPRRVPDVAARISSLASSTDMGAFKED